MRAVEAGAALCGFGARKAAQTVVLGFRISIGVIERCDMLVVIFGDLALGQCFVACACNWSGYHGYTYSESPMRTSPWQTSCRDTKNIELE